MHEAILFRELEKMTEIWVILSDKWPDPTAPFYTETELIIFIRMEDISNSLHEL